MLNLSTLKSTSVNSASPLFSAKLVISDKDNLSFKDYEAIL